MLLATLSAVLASPTFQNMFELGEKATWAEKILRPILVYGFLVILIRAVGRRLPAQLNPFDIVVILLLSNTVQNAIIGDDTSLIGGIVGGATLIVTNQAMAYLKFKSERIEKAAEGEPVTLIKDGKQDKNILAKELLTQNDLEIIAHEHDMEQVEDIGNLVLDPNGTFLAEGKDHIRDSHFKKETMKKIDELSRQMAELTALLKKA